MLRADSQPCCRPKRTESGLKKTGGGLISSSSCNYGYHLQAHLRKRTECGLALNNETQAKFFGMMVARDGVEPPTPAFSVRSTASAIK
jgi:hypothetical protein